MGRVIGFTKPIEVKRFESGHRVLRIYTHEDMVLLSQNGGGCAYAHSFWTETVKPPVEYFFVMEKDGDISSILFTKMLKWNRKPHPRDGELPEYGGWRDKTADRVATGSTMYDRTPRTLGDYHSAALQEALDRLKWAKRTYNNYKEEGIRLHGPLHKNHPYKADIDHANREVASCQSAVDAAKALETTPQIDSGMVFTWNRKKLIVLQMIGLGGDYLRPYGEGMRRWSEFCYPKEVSNAAVGRDRAGA